MTKELQHRNSSTSIWSIPVRSGWTVLGVGILLLSAVTTARSQEEKAPKPPTYTVLYTFTGGADGAFPNEPSPGPGLVRDAEDNLYGTATSGGDFSGEACGGPGFGCGVVFKLDRFGNQTVLHTFTGPPDGAQPEAGLIRDEEGNLYGTTIGGGSAGVPGIGNGTVFKIDRAGEETILYNFTGGDDGNGVYAGVIRDEQGNLYGTAQFGGSSGNGLVYKLDRLGKQTVLHTFTGPPDGALPEAGLIRDEQGNLYGATTRGGTSGIGVIFKLNPTGKETVLYSFAGGADGAYPEGGLVRDAAGTIYGTTAIGGAFNNGVVFRLDPAGKETVLYTFTGGTDGGFPYGTLLRVENDLYGTTFFGGNSTTLCGGPYCGVVFKLDQAGKETVLYSFTGAADGSNPYIGLARDEQGNLYGTSAYGGDLTSPECPGYGCGVVYKITLHDDLQRQRKEE